MASPDSPEKGRTYEQWQTGEGCDKTSGGCRSRRAGLLGFQPARPLSFAAGANSEFESAGLSSNLALRVDLKRSSLPPLEYYCEYNGERDYINFLFSPAVGTNRSIKTIPKGTKWILYADMVPWKGADPKTLFKRALLSDALP